MDKNQLILNNHTEKPFIVEEQVKKGNQTVINRIISKKREKRSFKQIDDLHRQKYQFIYNDKTITGKPNKSLEISSEATMKVQIKIKHQKIKYNSRKRSSTTVIRRSGRCNKCILRYYISRRNYKN